MTHQPQEGKVRNCLNCSFREYWSGDYGESSGNVCNKRQYRSELEESRHGTQLQNNAYLRAPKRCSVIEPAKSMSEPKCVCDNCEHYNSDTMASRCAKGHGGLFRIQYGMNGQCADASPRHSPRHAQPLPATNTQETSNG